MSKELEAFNTIMTLSKWDSDIRQANMTYNDFEIYRNNLVGTVKQALTPPTADEIVRELRKELPIYKEIVIKYSKKTKQFYYITNNNLRVNIIYLTHQNKLNISFEITPYLITMLGRFYKEENKK